MDRSGDPPPVGSPWGLENHPRRFGFWESSDLRGGDGSLGGGGVRASGEDLGENVVEGSGLRDSVDVMWSGNG